MSAAIPGSGDFYARNYSQGSIALVREIALIATLFHFNSQADHYDNSAKIFANKVMGIPKNMSSEYFDLISKQIGSDQYNENVRLNAQNYYGYGTSAYDDFVATNSISEEEAWDWESAKNLRKYKNYRAEKQKNKQNSSFVVGSIIVNHIYSAVYSAIKTSSNNKEFLNRHSIIVQPDVINQGVSLNYGFKF